MMLIDNEFEIGDYVYLSADLEQQIAIDVNVLITSNN